MCGFTDMRKAAKCYFKHKNMRKKGVFSVATQFGRTKIISKFDAIDAKNVVSALEAALNTHSANRSAIEFLYRYYRGITPVLDKQKAYRQEVNNRVGVALAVEIVSFYVGYILPTSISYARHDAERQDEEATSSIIALNDWARMAGKGSVDEELVEWDMICGTAYRACAPERDRTDETPFETYTLDPRNTFVAYSRFNGRRAVFAATIDRREDGGNAYTVYTRDRVYTIVSNRIVSDEANAIGIIPIVEYPANPLRIGAFEPVIPLLNALETIQSSRVDAVVQDVDNVLAIIGCDPGDPKKAGTVANMLRELRMLILPNKDCDAKYITAPLKQADIQTVTESILGLILTITGLPNRNGGSSTSDTGQAVFLRDGHSAAEGRARRYVNCFNGSEVEFLRIVRKIASLQGVPTAEVKDIEVVFPRRYSENVLTNVQALQGLIATGISIEDALPMVHLVSDPLDIAVRNKERIDRVLFGNETAENNSEVQDGAENNAIQAANGD